MMLKRSRAGRTSEKVFPQEAAAAAPGIMPFKSPMKAVERHGEENGRCSRHPAE